MFDQQRILILAPHTDDGELGCGASIAKYISAGKQVSYVAFSTCSQSLPAHLPSDILVLECKAATKLLGVQDVELFDFPVRRFHSYRQEILEELVNIARSRQPQVVFIPAQHDVHQDHQVIYAEGLRAFKNCNVLGYELPWNNVKFSPTYFEKLEERHLSAKQKALQEYQSQSHRKYMQPEFTRSLAVVRGMQCNATLAEGFEVYRMNN